MADESEQEQREEEIVPPWKDQITIRGMLVSLLLGIIFCVITHKLNLTVGIIPSLNVAAGLLGFFFVKTWTKGFETLGFVSKPFTRQENTVIQTCVVACYGIAFSGGLGSYILGMSKRTYSLIGPDYPGNNIEDVKDPSLGWIIAFIFTVSFVGVLALVPLRKVMILDYKLTYPSGTATALLINSFHTAAGAEKAKKQVHSLGKFFAGSFFWSAFKWFFSGERNSCGFEHFPTLGLKAYANTFYFDFSATYVGAGLICPHIVNVSVLLGAILSWGILWPIVSSRAGDWYPDGLESTDFKGLYGYKVFISIALIMGDGLYNLVKILYVTFRAMYDQQIARLLPLTDRDVITEPLITEAKEEEAMLNAVFMKEGIPFWIAATGYVILSTISIIVIPLIIPQVRWYYVLICYTLAPALGFCNAYGAGLTDWSLASTYGKLGLFIFAAWAGDKGGVIAGLATCGVMMSIVSTASDLMQDFKTGYLTASSPRSMFVSQLVGTIMGCIIAPLTFWMFWTAFDIGQPDSEYKAPYAVIFRQMGILGVEGLSALPSHCMEFCIAFFILAVGMNAAKDLTPDHVSKFIPVPMAMAIPFYVGAYFAIDMFVGTVIRFIWEKIDKEDADTFSGSVASGLICGDGVWTIPSAILALLKVNPPMCMNFFPTNTGGGH